MSNLEIDLSNESIELFYRKNRGRAQLIVIILHMAEINFKWVSDYVLSDLIKEDFLPFYQVPVLIDHEKDLKIAQSCAIVRYLSLKYGFYPTDSAKEIALNEQMMEEHVDMYNLIRNTNASKSVEGWIDLEKNSIPKHLNFCEKILSEIKPTDQYPFFSRSERPMMGDLAIFSILNFINELFPEMLKGYSELSKYYQVFLGIPQIQRYLQLDLPIYFVRPV